MFLTMRWPRLPVVQRQENVHQVDEREMPSEEPIDTIKRMIGTEQDDRSARPKPEVLDGVTRLYGN